jgi:hypothetical protein
MLGPRVERAQQHLLVAAEVLLNHWGADEILDYPEEQFMTHTKIGRALYRSTSSWASESA